MSVDPGWCAGGSRLASSCVTPACRYRGRKTFPIGGVKWLASATSAPRAHGFCCQPTTCTPVSPMICRSVWRMTCLDRRDGRRHEAISRDLPRTPGLAIGSGVSRSTLVSASLTPTDRQAGGSSVSRRGRLHALTPHSRPVLTVPLPHQGSVGGNQLGSPALLVIWACSAVGVGNGSRKRGASGIGPQVSGQFRGRRPYS